jgi:hypothetical protein
MQRKERMVSNPESWQPVGMQLSEPGSCSPITQEGWWRGGPAGRAVATLMSCRS